MSCSHGLSTTPLSYRAKRIESHQPTHAAPSSLLVADLNSYLNPSSRPGRINHAETQTRRHYQQGEGGKTVTQQQQQQQQQQRRGRRVVSSPAGAPIPPSSELLRKLRQQLRS
mmetsp:Transcript_25094/g.54346  ORF Transcript_25094/g.54346 Transcript_25094/m.54346 type:complete len:113 (-) Transcript_25094:136-474(-)